MRRTDSLEKILMLGKIEGRRKRGWQRIRWLDGIAHLMDMSLSKLWELVVAVKPGVLQSMGSQRVGYDWVTELNWNMLCSGCVPMKSWVSSLCADKVKVMNLQAEDQALDSGYTPSWCVLRKLLQEKLLVLHLDKAVCLSCCCFFFFNEAFEKHFFFNHFAVYSSVALRTFTLRKDSFQQMVLGKLDSHM